MVIKNNNQIFTALNNGTQMPLLGLGVYDMHAAVAESAVVTALETGYRLIDTAAMYGNEIEIGNAIRNSAVPREEIFVTTKVNNIDQGYDTTLLAFEASIKKLNIDYIDLYLVHWPIKGKRKDTWKALETLYNQKQVRAIGVANYLLPFMEELRSYANLVPVVNQVEFSPFLYLKELLQYCKANNIQLQAYTPLVRGKKMDNPLLLELAKKYGKTPAQIILRWNMEIGVSAIPKSASKERIRENFDIFDFSLSPTDIRAMESLHENLRLIDNPMEML
jgi:diketogulonate reductase-like aldo/keto reductase